VSNPNLSIEQSQAINQKSPNIKAITSAQLSKLFDLSQDTKDLRLIQRSFIKRSNSLININMQFYSRI
jgi:hypothetical protein